MDVESNLMSKNLFLDVYCMKKKRELKVFLKNQL